MTKFNVTRFGLALGVAAAIAFSGLARADKVNCQKGLEKYASAFQSTTLKALTKASQTMRKGPMDLKAAASVDKTLSGVYAATKAVDKLRTGVGGLSPGTCSDDDLTGLGLLLSGAGGNCAPGPTTIKFTEDYFLVEGEMEAYNMIMAQDPQFPVLLLQLQKLAGCPSSTYPYLCNAKQECSERVCNIGSAPPGPSTSVTNTKSWALGSTAVAPLSVADPMQMCFMDGIGPAPLGRPNISGTEPGFTYITGGKGRGLGLVNLGGGIYVCVDTLLMAGYCDCGGTGAAQKNVTSCQDRDIFRAPSCPTGLSDPGVDKCGSRCRAAQADVNYPGDYNGLTRTTCTTATTKGDCVVALTNQFSVITNALYGTDTRPCTADDTGGVDTPTTLLLTTGTSQSTLWNAVSAGGYGTCTADGSTACVSVCQNRCGVPVAGFCEIGGAPCSSKAPCNTACSAVTYDAVNPNFSPMLTGAKPVAGAFPYNVGANICDLYRQNRGAGMSLVGTFPGTSSADAGGLGDNMSWFNLDCK